MRRCRCRGYCSPKLLEEAAADQNIRLFKRLQPQISSPHFVHRRDLPARFEIHVAAGYVPATYTVKCPDKSNDGTAMTVADTDGNASVDFVEFMAAFKRRALQEPLTSSKRTEASFERYLGELQAELNRRVLLLVQQFAEVLQ